MQGESKTKVEGGRGFVAEKLLHPFEPKLQGNKCSQQQSGNELACFTKHSFNQIHNDTSLREVTRMADDFMQLNSCEM